MNKMFQSKLLAVALFSLFSASSQAVLMNPGDTVSLPGTTVADNPNLAGTIVVDEIQYFEFAAYGGTVSGKVQNRVVLAADGTYDFYWRVFNDENSAGEIGSFRIGDFYASTYDADFRLDGLGFVAPEEAHRFTGALDSYVNFDFMGNLEAGLSSMFFFLDTDATSYAKTLIYDLTNDNQTEISGLFYGYAPSYDVPAPATALLMGVGLLGLLANRRRKAPVIA